MSCKKSMDDLERFFNNADKDKNGSLDVCELRDVLRAADSNLTDDQLFDIFIFFDGPSGDKRITLQEFKQGMENINKFVQGVKDLFKKYDADGNGYLDIKEFKTMLGELKDGYKIAKDADKILRQADKNGDGKISLDEFLIACT